MRSARHACVTRIRSHFVDHDPVLDEILYRRYPSNRRSPFCWLPSSVSSWVIGQLFDPTVLALIVQALRCGRSTCRKTRRGPAAIADLRQRHANGNAPQQSSPEQRYPAFGAPIRRESRKLDFQNWDDRDFLIWLQLLDAAAKNHASHGAALGSLPNPSNCSAGHALCCAPQ
jgi:hypothetical protein